MMIKDQKGVTLVEILATLTLLSVVTILIWNIFIQGTNHTNKESTKNLLTQETNYVQFQLKKIHQTADEYKIIFPSDCSIQIEYSTPKSIISFDNEQICYEINDITNVDSDTPIDLNSNINPKKNQSTISFELILKDNKHEVVTYTILSRLKEKM